MWIPGSWLRGVHTICHCKAFSLQIWGFWMSESCWLWRKSSSGTVKFSWLQKHVCIHSYLMRLSSLKVTQHTGKDSERIRKVDGGLCIYVKNSWCTNSTIVTSQCSMAMEFMRVKCRTMYLPHELSLILIIILGHILFKLPPSELPSGQLASGAPPACLPQTQSIWSVVTAIMSGNLWYKQLPPPQKSMF